MSEPVPPEYQNSMEWRGTRVRVRQPKPCRSCVLYVPEPRGQPSEAVGAAVLVEPSDADAGGDKHAQHDSVENEGGGAMRDPHAPRCQTRGWPRLGAVTGSHLRHEVPEARALTPEVSP